MVYLSKFSKNIQVIYSFNTCPIAYSYMTKKIRWSAKKKKNQKLVHLGSHRVQKVTWFKTYIFRRYCFSYHWCPEHIRSYILQNSLLAESYNSFLYPIYKNPIFGSSSLFFFIGVTNVYYIFIPLSVKDFHKVDVYMQCLIVKNLNNYDIWGNSVLSLLRWQREVFHVCYYYVFIKLKYKGKSYKWYRKRRLMVLRFGYSHAVLLAIPYIARSKKAGKMKLVFFGTSKRQIRVFLTSVIKWKPMNVYNGRGLRISRQLVLRKFGKVSAYR